MASFFETHILLLAFIYSTLIHTASLFPMTIPDLRPKTNTGDVFYVSGVEELRRLGNGTVPDALLANVTPPEYYRQLSQVPQSDILSHLIAPPRTNLKRSVRSTAQSCPVLWVVNFDASRWPSRINKAVCNSQGSTCTTSDGKPGCEELMMNVDVYRYLGVAPNGLNVWKTEVMPIPIMCSCSGK